jgi:hypothetical protein
MSPSRPGLLLLVLLAPACQTGGPKPPPGPPAPLPDLLRPYEGALRLLPGRGDEKAIAVGAGEPLAGTCDVAVRVRSVAYADGTARFALLTVGEPRVGAGRVRCRRYEPGMQLTLSGLAAGEVTSEAAARIDDVLLAPEAYLRRRGTRFERPAGDAPSEVASRLPDASDAERRLARAVLAWPQPLLSVEASRRDPAGRAGHERLVVFEAVVGTDGRLHRPRLRGSLGAADEALVVDTLGLWRFEPARRADGPIAARVQLDAVLRVHR